MNMGKLRLVLWALVLIVGVGATVLYLVRPPERPVGLFGGDFALTSTKGGTFTQDDLKGIPSAVFFGYTYCPDVCPTTLAESTSWREDLKLGPEQFRLIFVSVDPERDTVEHLANYLSAFGDSVIGLTGTEAEVEKAKKAFGVFSERAEGGSETDYLIDHTATVFLIGADGRFVGTVDYREARATAIEKIKRLVGL
jgi:protein SCO1/2